MSENKEQLQKVESVEELRLVLSKQLLLLLLGSKESNENLDRKSDDEDPDEKPYLEELKNKLILEVIEATRENLPELLSNIKALFTIALLNIAQLNDEEFRQLIIDGHIPSPEQQLTLRLSELQTDYTIGQKTIQSLKRAIENPTKLNPIILLKVLGIITRKITKQPTYEAIKTLLDCVIYFWPNTNFEFRTKFNILFNQLELALAESDPIGTAQFYIFWQEEVLRISRDLDPRSVNNGSLHKTEQRPNYSGKLLGLLPPAAFDTLGHMLKRGVQSKSATIEELMDQFKDVTAPIIDYSPELVDGMINVFIEAGLVKRSKHGKISLTARGKKAINLGASELRSVDMANRFLLGGRSASTEIQNLDDVRERYEVSREKNAIPEIKLIIEGDERRFLYLGDILFGQKDLDYETLGRIVVWLDNLPDDEKPHQVIISGIVAGGFNFRKKDQRKNLVMRSMNEQFKAALLFINSIKEIGLEVSYVMSSEDFEQCRNYNIMAMGDLQERAKPPTDSQKGHVTYWQEDQLKQLDAWDTHYEFQINVAYPYNLRSGRRLRSADEVRTMDIIHEDYRHLTPEEIENTPGVFVRQEEYLLLFDAYQRLINNEPLPAHYTDILDLDNIPLPGKKFEDFGIFDGLKITTELGDGEERTTLLHHNFALTATTVQANPFRRSGELLGQMKASGIPVPDELVNFHNDVALGMGGSTRMVSTPGFVKTGMEGRTSLQEARDRSARQMFTRGTLPTPGGIMTGMSSSGLNRTWLFTPELMERASISPERMAIVPLVDTHIGSIASRVDYLVNLLDILVTQIIPNHPTVLLFGGDHLESRNYPSMPNEHALLGLVRMIHQEQYLLWLLEMSLTQGRDIADLPTYLDHITNVGIVPGNHELNSMTKFTGYDYTNALQIMMRLLLERKDKPEVVRNLQSLVTPDGNFLQHPSGFMDVGGYGVWLSHQFAGKGGSPQVLKAKKMMQGLGQMFADTNICITGHFHKEQWAVINGKLMLISPSMAGPTPFELGLGVASSPSANIIFVGGKEPVRLDSLSKKLLATHVIKQGPFSEEALADSNPHLTTDLDFDPLKDGLVSGPFDPHSALQKKLLLQAHKIVHGNPSRTG